MPASATEHCVHPTGGPQGLTIDLWRSTLNAIAQAAFEAIDLQGLEVADKLRDMHWESERFKKGDESLSCRGEGVFFCL